MQLALLHELILNILSRILWDGANTVRQWNHGLLSIKSSYNNWRNKFLNFKKERDWHLPFYPLHFMPCVSQIHVPSVIYLLLQKPSLGWLHQGVIDDCGSVLIFIAKLALSRIVLFPVELPHTWSGYSLILVS